MHAIRLPCTLNTLGCSRCLPQLDAFATIWRTEGLRGFYRGWAANSLKVIPQVRNGRASCMQHGRLVGE